MEVLFSFLFPNGIIVIHPARIASRLDLAVEFLSIAMNFFQAVLVRGVHANVNHVMDSNYFRYWPFCGFPNCERIAQPRFEAFYVHGELNLRGEVCLYRTFAAFRLR